MSFMEEYMKYEEDREDIRHLNTVSMLRKKLKQMEENNEEE